MAWCVVVDKSPVYLRRQVPPVVSAFGHAFHTLHYMTDPCKNREPASRCVLVGIDHVVQSMK
jgi:hypothetical protein